MKINLDILFQKPEKTVKTMLTIEPLAPLSMVSTMPGSFYKTLAEPSKFHLCGALENTLGWHFEDKDRKAIQKRVNKFYEKVLKLSNPEWFSSEVGFLPITHHLFEILPLKVLPAVTFYKDLWKQMRKRSDGYSHPNGTMNMSYEIIPLKMDLARTEKGTVTNDAITEFYKENIGKYPMYYTSAGNREFVLITEGMYRYNLLMTEGFYNALEIAISENNLAYLGTNEGWVNLKIQKL